jgi:chromosome segregation ATPase
MQVRAELHALQQLRDANAANSEKITKLNEKHQSELKMLQQEISKLNHERAEELRNLQMAHMAEMRKIHEAHIDELRRIQMEHQDGLRTELVRERHEKKSSQQHMSIQHERMQRHMADLQEQLKDLHVNGPHNSTKRILCPGGPDMMTESKRKMKTLEDEMVSIRQNMAELPHGHHGFNTAASDAGGMSVAPMGMGGSQYGGPGMGMTSPGGMGAPPPAQPMAI